MLATITSKLITMKIATRNFLSGTLVFFFLLTIYTKTYSQVDFSVDNSSAKAPVAFIGIGMGLEAYTGILGLTVEVSALENLSVFGAVGLGSWGNKVGGGVLYYFKEMPFGSAFGIGYSYATGLASTPFQYYAIDGTTLVDVYYRGAGTVIPSYSHGWKLGKNFNRFILTTGYSVKTSNKTYSLANKNDVLHPDSIKILKILEPGGLMIGIKFVFAIAYKTVAAKQSIDDF